MSVLDDLQAERLALVERLRTLPAEQWRTPSLCAGWTVQHVLAHLCAVFTVSPVRLGLDVVQARGVAGGMDRTARRLGAKSPYRLLDVLADNAASSKRPPLMPLAAPLTDTVVHGLDIRWALGDDHADTGDPQRLVPVLDFLTGQRARVGFVPPGRLRGLRLQATDVGWAHGSGARVEGPALSLAAAVLGRRAALVDLTGDGVAGLK